MLQEGSNHSQISSSIHSAADRTPIGVILSIKPIFVEAIFSGRKISEYRRKLFKSRVPQRVFVYASAPISLVVGYFDVAEILSDTPTRL